MALRLHCPGLPKVFESSPARVPRRYRPPISLLLWVLALMALIPLRVSAAVTVSSFTATAQGNQVLVEWTTATEISNVGFNLLRSTAQGGNYAKIAGIPSNNPMSLMGSSYSYTDGAVSIGQTYFYKLQSVDSNGRTEDFGPASVTLGTTNPPQQATNTPVPTGAPTATKSPAPTKTNAPAATLTGAPTATRTPIPNSTPGVLPTATPTLARFTTAGTHPSPTQGQPTPVAIAKTQPEDEAAPTPAITLIATAADQKNAGGDGANHDTTGAPTQTNALDRAYYVKRLVNVGILLASSALLLGSVVCGIFALFLFLRAYLR